MAITWSSFLSVTLRLLEGFETTCLIFALTLVLALPLGLGISFGSMSKFKPLAYLTKVFVWIIRGVPLMLQIFVVFYVPRLLWDMSFFTRFNAVIVAFVINYACYFSEIYRGGIESIPRGQYEAGEVLGMKKSQIFFRVVLLQVVKRIIPPMGNEIITLVKDTSLVRVISVYELMWNGQNFIKSEGIIWPMLFTGVYYLLFSGILTIFLGWLEKKMDYFKV
jgi:polar amino acid transport system permease protein